MVSIARLSPDLNWQRNKETGSLNLFHSLDLPAIQYTVKHAEQHTDVFRYSLNRHQSSIFKHKMRLKVKVVWLSKCVIKKWYWSVCLKFGLFIYLPSAKKIRASEGSWLLWFIVASLSGHAPLTIDDETQPHMLKNSPVFKALIITQLCTSTEPWDTEAVTWNRVVSRFHLTFLLTQKI